MVVRARALILKPGHIYTATSRVNHYTSLKMFIPVCSSGRVCHVLLSCNSSSRVLIYRKLLQVEKKET